MKMLIDFPDDVSNNSPYPEETQGVVGYGYFIVKTENGKLVTTWGDGTACMGLTSKQSERVVSVVQRFEKAHRDIDAYLQNTE